MCSVDVKDYFEYIYHVFEMISRVHSSLKCVLWQKRVKVGKHCQNELLKKYNFAILNTFWQIRQFTQLCERDHLIRNTWYTYKKQRLAEKEYVSKKIMDTRDVEVNILQQKWNFLDK